MLEDYKLPDGRYPLRFDKGRAAFYPKAHGKGEVRYLFSMIKHIQRNRQLLSHEELSAIAKKRVEKRLHEDPSYFKKIGSLGGRVTKPKE